MTTGLFSDFCPLIITYYTGWLNIYGKLSYLLHYFMMSLQFMLKVKYYLLKHWICAFHSTLCLSGVCCVQEQWSVICVLVCAICSMEICDDRKNIIMCPMCDRVCSYWNLSTACSTARASHLFDNPATVFFSIFMALWGELSTHVHAYCTHTHKYVHACMHNHTVTLSLTPVTISHLHNLSC